MNTMGADLIAAWPREQPTPFDTDALVDLYAGEGRIGPWRIAITDRRIAIFGCGSHIGTWFLFPETTDGDIAMLAAQAASALASGGGLMDCNHRKFGAAESLGYASFKQLVDRSEFLDFGRFGAGRGWRSEPSGGPPHKLWGPPLRIEDPAVREAYDHFARGWVSRFNEPRHWIEPCPLDMLRPYVAAWPEATVDRLRYAAYESRAIERDLTTAEADLCARFAERLNRPDIAHWYRTGKLPAPAPRPLSEWRDAWKAYDGAGEWVYVLRESDGDRVKIGKSEIHDPLLRIRTHQTSSSQGRHLDIVAVLLGHLGLEGKLHARFRKHLVPGKKEWFRERGAVLNAVGDGFVQVASELQVAVLLP